MARTGGGRRQARDAKGRFASTGSSSSGRKSASQSAATPAAKLKVSRSAAGMKGGINSALARKERAQADRDQVRGISTTRRDVANANRRTKRANAYNNAKAGKAAVPGAKGLAVKTRGPLAGVRRAAFKAVAKVKRAVRRKDRYGKKLPRWAVK